MARALRLAEQGLFTTHPNPRVGCVIVRDGEIVGEGWHQRAGEPHAEVHALRAAGENARGATVYVTLEPCSHYGRTPPCANALVEAGVGRVVAAMVDPNPLVSGKGLEILRAAGIDTESGLLEAQARALNPGFIKRMETGFPWVRVKSAMSLDGRTAMANGESKWITGEAARADVHRLRARSEAIVTGIGTVLADDPSMNVRLDNAREVVQPLRVVLDPDLMMPADAQMLSLPGDTLVLTSVGAGDDIEDLVAAGAEIRWLGGDAEHVDLAAVLKTLAELGVNEVMVEAGATLSGAFLTAGLVDELIVYLAPHLMGDGARGLFHLPGIARMAQRIDLEISDIRSVGRDLRITARPVLIEATDGHG
ncbi:MAG: bifunctional diaminohydroxyphosphoribosylaminopyrimidine deaminase/5-amino-6-(5-phosphoribosylamino)uracil reductase RibD [Gammaproteobacteria bacterium]|nr:bifunctional diaminohydroxyphosphoribosylaminopyrimidine deaminase/5-amino-6-(5-phosphoribosylamino)uracil reductase RibD [Gammaproteobacteria bacterium]MCP5135795.1 bifunctional diaminohydroxyphosphoribosylaminopyrimidine deaminase/5-amino-6-(5-phosphoribosylamino)uracil reductase RibD [Gammaproteobacteria bacterium]